MKWYPRPYTQGLIRNTTNSSQHGSYDDLGAICKKPEELTALSLFLRETNAELCGNNINKPYRHLNKYGYFSGSRSWSLKSTNGDPSYSSTAQTNTVRLTGEYRGFDKLY